MVYQSAPSIFTKWTLLPNFTIEFVVNPILRGFSVQYLEDHRIMKTGRPDGASPRGFPKAAGLGVPWWKFSTNPPVVDPPGW